VPLRTPEGELVTLKTAADAYAIVIQAGAILAVLILYWGRVWQVILGVLGLSPNGRLLARNLIVAFLPAAVLGLLLDDWIESMLFAPLPIAIALIAGGLLMLAVESWRKHQLPDDDDVVDLHTLGVRQCLFIGFMQCIAMWPGTSRSMMTIVGGYIAGLRNRPRAAEFSFLARADHPHRRSRLQGREQRAGAPPGHRHGTSMMLGIFVAFVSAALAVKWLVSYLTRHGLALFAWYRFILAGLVVYLPRALTADLHGRLPPPRGIPAREPSASETLQRGPDGAVQGLVRTGPGRRDFKRAQRDGPLATVDPDGQPWTRTVLLKKLDDRGPRLLHEF
jgi:undecaprenyl-diphosphatase